MPYKVKTEFEGMAGWIAALDALPKKLRKKVLRKAVNDAARTLLWAARARVPKRLPGNVPRNVAYKGGQLKKSLGRKVKVYPSGAVVGIVGARQGFRIEVGTTTRDGKKQQAGSPIFVNPVKYLHLVELGTRRAKGTHFLQRAMEQNKASIRDRMVAAIDEAIRGTFS